MSDSVRSYPWNSPGKNTGVGCHFLLQCIKVKSESEVALGSLNSFLSCVTQISGANPVSLFTLHLDIFTVPQRSPCWAGMAASPGSPFWEPLFTFGGQKSVTDGCGISCWLTWQKTFSFHTALPSTLRYPGPTAILAVPRVLQKQIIKSNNNKAIKK